MTNPMCDGSGPCRPGQVRVLPTGGDGNGILCRACYYREIAYRRERNQELSEGCKFALPQWESLKTYGEEYQPKTGAKCGCKRGVMRDNCPNCEGTGYVIDFAQIRARRTA